MKKAISLIAIVMVFVFSVNICFADSVATTQTTQEATEEAQTTPEAKHPMKDLSVDTELGESVLKLYDAGVINGYKEADGTYTYRADKSITRGEFCKMINTTFGYTQEADNKFKDVNPKNWYYVQVVIAIHYGYIQGHGDGTFGGDGYITREQVCVILDRIVNKKAETKPQITDKVSSWAKDAVENIVGLGYMPLEEDGKFRAKEYMTRGELALTIDDFVTVKAPEENTDKDKPQEDKKEEHQKPKPSTPSGDSPSGEEDSDEYEDIGGSDDSTEKSYTITYNADGGKLSNQKKSYKSSDADYTLPTPTRNGYKFMGWFEDKNADVASAEPVTKLASGSSGNKTYYAKWAKSYTINYVLHPAEYEKEDDPTILGKLDGTQKKSYCQYDEEYVLPTPTRDDGEEFLGWYEAQTFKGVKDTIIITDEYKVTSIPAGSEGNKTYHAVWQDMADEADDTYYWINDAISEIDYIKDLMPIATESGILRFFETALPEVSSWESQSVLVTKKLVREMYKSDAEDIKVIYLALQDAGQGEDIKNELMKLNSIDELVTIFGINIKFGTGDIGFLE